MPKILPFPPPRRSPFQIVLQVRIETGRPRTMEAELRAISDRYRQEVIKLLAVDRSGEDT